MIRFPNCKINLGLRVTCKRTDGYHDIETIFFPVALKDSLELTVAKNAQEECSLHLYGPPIPGEKESNLCYKAWKLIKADYPGIPSLRFDLLKAIPAGAGLGGGSSNGAHALLLVNEELKLGISDEQLAAYALQLGSDCPFFLYNKPCFASGRGELLEPVNINLASHYFVLVTPELHISTAWAFGSIHPRDRQTEMPLQHIVQLSVNQWKDRLQNDFEEPVLQEYPELATIKNELYLAGAVYASLSGTGSCIYGMFPRKSNPDLSSISKRHKLFNLKENR